MCRRSQRLIVSSFFAMLADCTHTPSYGLHSFVTLQNEQMELALIVGANIEGVSYYICICARYCSCNSREVPLT